MDRRLPLFAALLLGMPTAGTSAPALPVTPQPAAKVRLSAVWSMPMRLSQGSTPSW